LYSQYIDIYTPTDYRYIDKHKYIALAEYIISDKRTYTHSRTHSNKIYNTRTHTSRHRRKKKQQQQAVEENANKNCVHIYMYVKKYKTAADTAADGTVCFFGIDLGAFDAIKRNK